MRKGILISGAVVLAICLWLLLHRKAEIPNSVTPQTSTSTAQTNTERQSQAKESAVAAVSTTAPQEPVGGPSTSTSNSTNGLNPTVSEIWQKPINFYGKVVDENNNPISDATVSFRWDDMTAPDFTRTSTDKSDSAGLFSLRDKRGATLGVSVGKEGYYSSQKDTNSFHYAVPPNNLVFSPDRANPVIFHLHKKGQGEVLTTSNSGMESEFSVLVPRDGTPISVDLLQRKTAPSGDLEISQVKPERASLQQATNWSFHMRISNGGFVEENDDFVISAPEGGYQPTVDLDFTKGGTNWATQFTKTYYITFGQPAKYGWFQVRANIAQQTVFLRYSINPSGSRNLEPAN